MKNELGIEIKGSFLYNDIHNNIYLLLSLSLSLSLSLNMVLVMPKHQKQVSPSNPQLLELSDSVLSFINLTNHTNTLTT